MDACHVLLGRPWQFDREVVHEGKRNVYSFEMNGKKNSLDQFKGKQEEVNNHFLMMMDTKMVTNWKAKENDNEVELTNMLCSGWMKDETYQQKMFNASMELMEEAQYEVINNNGKCMVTEITKDSDVAVTITRKEGQILQVENSWISCIIMLISFMFIVVRGRLNCISGDEGELVDNFFTGQRKEDFDYLMKSEHMLEPKDLLPTQCWKQVLWFQHMFRLH